MSSAVPRKRSWLWLQGLICGAVISIATAPAVLLVTLLAPGLTAYAIETTKGKPHAEAMLLLGLATSLSPVHTLWEAGMGMDACVALITDPSRTGFCWLAGGAGWLMVAASQMIARQHSELSTRRRVAALRKERAELTTEWGVPL